MSELLDIQISVNRTAPDIQMAVDRSGRAVEMAVSRGGTYYPTYDGPVTFTPSAEAQTVATRHTVLLENIIINPIPNNYGLITYNGNKITVS